MEEDQPSLPTLWQLPGLFGTIILQVCTCMYDAPCNHGVWYISNLDTNGAGESVIVSEVRGVLISEVEMHARVVLGWEKVSCLERCQECPHI